jgi:hypothetical protein
MVALANTIEDAFITPLGIELNDLPYTFEKFWRAVQNRSLNSIAVFEQHLSIPIHY